MSATNRHHYTLDLEWTGNRGAGTTGYRDYGRQGVLRAEGKPDWLSSADPTFRGDRDRWNPEEMLLAALANCHMLAYLHVAVTHGIVVVGYRDRPTGTMTQSGIGGAFTEVVLHPEVTVADVGQVEAAEAIHAEASAACFIAASVNFPVEHEPVTRAATG